MTKLNLILMKIKKKVKVMTNCFYLFEISFCNHENQNHTKGRIPI